MLDIVKVLFHNSLMPTVNTKLDRLKKPAVNDWHKADIICGLWKLGTSIQKLSRENNYKGNGLEQALRRNWPKGERIIADALGVTPQQIWPSRYHTDGTPRSGRGERGLSHYKDSTGERPVNVCTQRAA